MLEKYSGIIAIVVLLIILVAYIRYKANQPEDEEEEPVVEERKVNNASPLNLNDEDATVAALVASIECRNETKKDVRVISVKEI